MAREVYTQNCVECVRAGYSFACMYAECGLCHSLFASDDCVALFRLLLLLLQSNTMKDNNKIMCSLAMPKGELIDVIELVYRGARKGKGLVVSPKDYSTKYRY